MRELTKSIEVGVTNHLPSGMIIQTYERMKSTCHQQFHMPSRPVAIKLSKRLRYYLPCALPVSAEPLHPVARKTSILAWNHWLSPTKTRSRDQDGLQLVIWIDMGHMAMEHSPNLTMVWSRQSFKWDGPRLSQWLRSFMKLLSEILTFARFAPLVLSF